jgi:hypothetical protein
MANFSVDKYSFLKDLGIQQDNYGCFLDGKWIGSGEWITSFNPNDN